MVWKIILAIVSIAFSCNSFAMPQCPKDPIEAEKLFDRWTPGKKNQLVCYGCGSEDIEPVSCFTCCLPLHQKYVHPDFYYKTEITSIKNKILKKVIVTESYPTYERMPTYVDGYESKTTVARDGIIYFTTTKPRIMGGGIVTIPKYKEVEKYVEEWVVDPTRKRTQHYRVNNKIYSVYAITKPRSYKTILEEISKKTDTIPMEQMCMGCLHQCHYDNDYSASAVCDSNTNYVFDIPMKQCKCSQCVCYKCCRFSKDSERSDIEKGLAVVFKQSPPAMQDFVDLKVVSKLFDEMCKKNGEFSEPATLF